MFRENPLKWIKEHVAAKTAQQTVPAETTPPSQVGHSFTDYVSDVWKNSSKGILFARIGGTSLGTVLATHGTMQFMYAKPNKETGEIDEKPKGPALAEIAAGAIAVGASILAGRTR